MPTSLFRKFKPTSQIPLQMGILLLAGCASNEPGADKYLGFPEEAIDLSVPPDVIQSGSADVGVTQGTYQRFTFEKIAGYTYTVGLTDLSADLDLFGHWIPEVGWSSYQFRSLNYGTQEEQFTFDATETGIYYLGVYGYESGSGTLELYMSGGGNESAALNVPYLKQQLIPEIGPYACSSASTAMILAYYGVINSDQASMIEAAEVCFAETASTDGGLQGRDGLTDYLEGKMGFSSAKFDQSPQEELYRIIQREIDDKRPLILGSRSMNKDGHYLVVTGYDGKNYQDASLVVNDPFGDWNSWDSWDTAAYGEGVRYDFTAITASASDGVFVIVP